MKEKQEFYLNEKGQLVKKVGKNFHNVDAINLSNDKKKIVLF
jgi:hypothetical protein